MEIRRAEYEYVIDNPRAPSTTSPWTPEGLEAVWSAQHSTHPRFMDIRRAEYEGIQNLQGSTASVQ